MDLAEGAGVGTMRGGCERVSEGSEMTMICSPRFMGMEASGLDVEGRGLGGYPYLTVDQCDVAC